MVKKQTFIHAADALYAGLHERLLSDQVLVHGLASHVVNTGAHDAHQVEVAGPAVIKLFAVSGHAGPRAQVERIAGVVFGVNQDNIAAPRLPKLTNFNRLASGHGSGRRFLAGGLGEFGPDAAVGFLAEHLPRQLTFGVILYTPRFGWVHIPASRQALVKVLLIDAVRDSEPLAIFDGYFFRHGAYLSDSLQPLQAIR